MICSMVRESKSGLTTQNMKLISLTLIIRDPIKKAKRAEKEPFISQTRASILVNSKITKFLATGNTLGVMERFIKANGSIIK